MGALQILMFAGGIFVAGAAFHEPRPPDGLDEDMCLELGNTVQNNLKESAPWIANDAAAQANGDKILDMINRFEISLKTVGSFGENFLPYIKDARNAGLSDEYGPKIRSFRILMQGLEPKLQAGSSKTGARSARTLWILSISLFVGGVVLNYLEKRGKRIVVKLPAEHK